MPEYFTDDGVIHQYVDHRQDLSFPELFQVYAPKKSVITAALKAQKQERARIFKLRDETRSNLAAKVPFKDLEMALALVGAATWWRRLEQIEDLIQMNEGLLRIQTHKSRAAEVIAIPITDFMAFNRMGFGKCPFHNDKAPSMRYYKRDNRAHCFAGCGQKNVIQVYAQIKGFDTKQAFKELVATLS